MITIKNDYLTAKINEVGAELKSLVYNDIEYIYGKGKKKFGQVLVRFCSRYAVDLKTINMY